MSLKQKKTIPVAVREQVWIRNIGKRYDSKCSVSWCQNGISVFDFQVGHDHAESKGGSLRFDNLQPICSRCNSSMGNRFNFENWNLLGASSLTKMSFFRRFVRIFLGRFF